MCAADAVLCSDISCACALLGEAFATIRLARRRFPDDLTLAFEWCRVQAVRGQVVAAMRSAEELLARVSGSPRLLVLCLLASLTAQIGLGGRSQQYISELGGSGQISDPRVWFELASAAMSLREWDAAIERAAYAVSLAPKWPRARIFLAEALLARGHTDRSLQTVRECLGLGIEDAGLELMAGLQLFQGGDHRTSFELLLRFEYTWVRPRRTASIRELIEHLPWRLDQLDHGLQRLQPADAELCRRLQAHATAGRRLLIPIPVMCQERVLCVPTSVAMAAGAQGDPLDPNQLYVAMGGREGTAMWLMREEMLRRGYTVEIVCAEPEVIRALLDQGVSLIGQLEGVFNNHVEVICGYDTGSGVLFIRDPESWMPAIMKEEGLATRYELSGAGLIALVPPARQPQVSISPSWRAPVAASLLELERACALSDLEAAEAAHRAIPDDSPAVIRRDSVGRGITLTPAQYARSMQAIARAPERPLARVRAIMALDSPDLIDEVLESLEDPRKELGAITLRFINLMLQRGEGHWQELLGNIDWLLKRLPNVDSLWLMRAEALAELGRTTESQASVANALELSPDSAWVRNRARILFPTRRPVSEEIQELLGLIERYPYSHELKHDLAILQRSNDDGLAYEQAEQVCAHHHPRLTESYARRAYWYLVQERPDLARAVLDQGRVLIGEEELPKWQFELNGEPAEVVSPAAGNENEAGAADAAAADKTALLNTAQLEVEAVVERPGRSDRETPPSVRQLRRLQARGELQWFEAAELLGLELNLAAAGADNAEAAVAATRRLLPQHLPGPHISALGLVLDRTQLTAFPRQVAELMLSWARTLGEGATLPPEVRFHLGLLQETCGDFNSAQRAYEALAEEHPGYAAPFFRLGMLLARKGDLAASLDAHNRAVAGNPSLDGSLDQIIALCRHLDKADEAVAAQRAMCRLYPYHPEVYMDLVLLTRELHGYLVAWEEKDEQGTHQTPAVRAQVYARLLAEAGCLELARKMAGSRAPESERERYWALTTSLICALSDNDNRQIESLLATGLSAFPDDLWLLSLQGDRLGRRDPTAAFHHYQGILLRGVAQEHFARRFLQLIETEHALKAIALLEAAETGLRPALAAAMSTALYDIGKLEERLKLLQWCHQHLPDALDLREELAYQLAAAGHGREAVQVAQLLYQTDPRSPHWLHLMGFCLRRVNPEQALRFHAQEHRLTGSVACLSQIGLCYQAMGQPAKARETLLQVLKRAPENAVALTAMVQSGEPPGQYYHAFCAAIERSQGVDIPFFHVSAVLAALATDSVLPPHWLQTARKRFQVSLAEAESGEQLQLGQALAEWFEAWGNPAEARRIRGLAARNGSRRLDLTWPGQRWIPRPE
jgi:tetratricopeptide (TPR) repeat protein